jgi:hypothetical protein
LRQGEPGETGIEQRHRVRRITRELSFEGAQGAPVVACLVPRQRSRFVAPAVPRTIGRAGG